MNLCRNIVKCYVNQIAKVLNNVGKIYDDYIGTELLLNKGKTM